MTSKPPVQRVSSNRDRQLQTGMTLIELVIAVAITAIIGLISAQLLGAMIQNSQQITDHASELERLDRGLRIIQSDFDQLVVRGENSLLTAEDSSVPGLLIEFTRLHEQPLALHTTGPANSLNSDQLERVRYVLESNNLVRYSSPVGMPIDEDHWYQNTLFTRLSQARLYFLYEDWSEQLSDATKSPGSTPLGAIRFEAESDRWQHLELVSMLRTGADS
ncbi:type II secretion system protein J [Neptunomonas sp.]|uniref:PulJ/GspJ family protein n=1 Tax=Neptunomonas TaxID=75687 RepID=UPI003513084B